MSNKEIIHRTSLYVQIDLFSELRRLTIYYQYGKM